MKISRALPFVTLFSALVGFHSASRAGVQAAPSYTPARARGTLPRMAAAPVAIALYDDTGVFEDSVIASEAAWHSVGALTVRLSASDIKAGVLSGYDVLEVPGGWAGDYNSSLGSDGLAAIRTFVQGGGGYFGICAGAYLASNRVRWEGRPLRYTLDLVDVTAIGPLEAIAPWPEFAMTGADYQAHAITAGLTDPAQVLYYGGAWFQPARRTSAAVVATYLDASVAGNPAMIAAGFGAGRVFLTGLHPEIEEGSSSDNVSGWDTELVDPESDWPLMRQVLEWLRFQR